MSNSRQKETKLTLTVVDCDGCGEEFWEGAIHELDGKDYCEKCCPATWENQCPEYQMNHL